jgi:molybdopterin/thiamine biosynthesis adenylyltransferase
MKNNDRYSRHTLYKNFGRNSQALLKKSEITIAGIGALGCVTANLLARAGVGKIILIDFDKIESMNLHRQLLFDEKDIGKNKAESAKEKLQNANSDIQITACTEKIDNANAEKLLKGNIVIDCTDNMDARLLINKICRKKKIPLLHIAALEDTGIVIFYENKKKNDPCLRCVYNEKMPSKKCSEFGVLNTITSTIAGIGSMQAIKYLIRKSPEKNTIIRLNIWDNSIIKTRLKKNDSCPVCHN